MIDSTSSETKTNGVMEIIWNLSCLLTLILTLKVSKM